MKKSLLLSLGIVISGFLGGVEAVKASSIPQELQESYNRAPVYFSDGVNQAGQFYCGWPKTAVIEGFAFGEMGYNLSLRNKPTLTVNRVNATMSYKLGNLNFTRPMNTEFIGTLALKEEPIAIPKGQKINVSFTGHLHSNEQGRLQLREQLLVFGANGGFEKTGVVVCPSWDDETNTDPNLVFLLKGDNAFLNNLVTFSRKNPRAYNNIVKFIRLVIRK